MNSPWEIVAGDGPVVATAIHNGHDLRAEVSRAIGIDEATRAYEEDHHTALFTQVCQTRVVVNRSRFEFDLNRPVDEAICAIPDDCWDLEVWPGELDVAIADRSRELHRQFYEEIRWLLGGVEARYGRFVVLDLHAYNHRRGGPDAPPADQAGNPDVNIGTGSMNRDLWGDLVDRFMTELAEAGDIDVRENVKFKGRELARFVHTTWPETGCCIAVEFKKTFMDEHTGELDEERTGALIAALRSTLHGLETSLKEMS